jgi:predicted DNA-binding transcriptional regulator YafY
MEVAPENLMYDRRSRIYLAGPAFRPIFASSSTPNYLNDLLALEAGYLEPESSFTGWRPPMALVPTPGRQINAQTLTTLLQAIREQKGVRVSYQSMTHPEPQTRDLSPHAIAHDGFRWHVRAYCHKRKEFLDFVIARVLEIDYSERSGPGPLEDEAWQTKVDLVLAPHPGLSLSKRRAIELDYGMEDGKATLTCRQALLFYLLKHLRLDIDQLGTPEADQIILLNEAEVKASLKELQRKTVM